MADVERMLALLGSASCPMQLVIAGKAHPKDEEAKRMVCRLFEYRDHPGFAGRIVFLEEDHASVPR